MDLMTALGVQRRDVVTFTGAGGKTSALFRLCEELVLARRRVVVTTTARLGRTQIPVTVAGRRVSHIILERVEDLSQAVSEAFRESPVVAVTNGAVEAGTKWLGIAPSAVRALAEAAGTDVVLVEGDGSRSLPLKAPAEHEPVVPDATTLLVPVAGATALGQPADEGHVHRPELVARFGNWGPQDERVVTVDLLVALMSHPAGGLKGLPVHDVSRGETPRGRAPVRVVVMLNQCDEGRLEPMRPAARGLLATRGIEAVLLTAVAPQGAMPARGPVLERHVRVSGVLLAAGASERFGTPKQLLPWGPRRVPLVAHVAEQVRAAPSLTDVYVVVGHRAIEVAARVAGERVAVVVCRAWARGQAHSLRAGLRALAPDAGAVAFVLCDQPGVTAEIIEALVQRHRETGAMVVVPRDPNGRRGTPTLWDRRTFGALRRLRGDTGGRGLIDAYAARGMVAWVEVPEAALWDIDTPDDLLPFRDGQPSVV